MSQNQRPNYTFALTIVIIVCFLIGFVTTMNNSMIEFCKNAFNLNNFQSQLVNSAFYGAYIMSIPFGLMSETLDAHNVWRGMVYGMPPRLPWSGNPVPIWKLWDATGMKDAVMYGWWDPACPVTTDNASIKATVYKLPDGRALIAVANWSRDPQEVRLTVDPDRLGFTPASATLPAVETLQPEAIIDLSLPVTIEGSKGMFILVE